MAVRTALRTVFRRRRDVAGEDKVHVMISRRRPDDATSWPGVSDGGGRLQLAADLICPAVEREGMRTARSRLASGARDSEPSRREVSADAEALETAYASSRSCKDVVTLIRFVRR